MFRLPRACGGLGLVIVGAVIIGSQSDLAHAQDSGRLQYVVTRGPHANLADPTYEIVKDFANPDDAAKYARERNHAETDLAITYDALPRADLGRKGRPITNAVSKGKELLGQLKEAKAAVDRAKQVEQGESSILKVNQRRLGDTIKEYKDMLKKSYAQVVEARKTLTGGVAVQTDARMREVNKLIDTYNSEVQNLRQVMGKDADLGFTPLSRLPDPKTAAEVVGTWTGTCKQSDGKSWEVKLTFSDDAAFGYQDGLGGSGSGSWSRDGDRLTITWTTGITETFEIKNGEYRTTYRSRTGLSYTKTYRKQ